MSFAIDCETCLKGLINQMHSMSSSMTAMASSYEKLLADLAQGSICKHHATLALGEASLLKADKQKVDGAFVKQTKAAKQEEKTDDDEGSSSSGSSTSPDEMVQNVMPSKSKSVPFKFLEDDLPLAAAAAKRAPKRGRNLGLLFDPQTKYEDDDIEYIGEDAAANQGGHGLTERMSPEFKLDAAEADDHGTKKANPKKATRTGAKRGRKPKPKETHEDEEDNELDAIQPAASTAIAPKLGAKRGRKAKKAAN